MEKGCSRPYHLKGEVFANSFEEAFEKYTKGEVFYDLVVDDYCKEEYNISDDNEIIVTLLEENDK